MSLRRAVLPFTLVATMVASSFQMMAIGVLAVEIIDDLDISRGVLGSLVAANTGIGALTSPWTGRLTDRIGPRLAVVIVLLVSAFGMGLTAMATSFWLLLVASVVLGIPQGWGNPATNSLIAARVAPGRRGAVTGVKQSGVTLGVFLAGVTMPGLSELTDWRGACWVYAGVFLAMAVVVIALLPAGDGDRPAPTPTGEVRGAPEPIESFVWRIAVYAFLLGAASSGIGRFLALFANEELGMSVTVAGLVIALTGLLGMVTRVWAARLAESRVEPTRLLVALAWSAVACALLLTLATTIGSWLMWPIAVMFAFGFTAWNAVAMLAVITGAGRHGAGRASGVVMFGFLGGATVGAPLAGFAVDVAGSYQAAWWIAVLLSFCGAMVLTGPARAASRRQTMSSIAPQPGMTVVE